jgi:hypothetical protein
MTWSTQCTVKDVQGRSCGLPAGHAGDHQLATFAPAPAKTTFSGTIGALVVLVAVIILITIVSRVLI